MLYPRQLDMQHLTHAMDHRCSAQTPIEIKDQPHTLLVAANPQRAELRGGGHLPATQQYATQRRLSQELPPRGTLTGFPDHCPFSY